MIRKIALFILSFQLFSSFAAEPIVKKDIFYYDDVKLIDHDVEYARERCKLDLFIPGNDETKRPVVLFFHGGGLRGGKKYFPEALKNSGAIVVSANYRLSGERAKCPDYLYDAAAAANWVFKHIVEYGGDPDCVIISGHSAGAYLSAMVGMDARYLARFGEKNTRFLLIAPVSGQMTTHFQIQNERLGTHQEIAEHVVVDECAPIWHAKKGLSPIILFTGGVDLDWPARPQENQLLYSVLRKIHHDERAKIYCIDGFGHSECIEPALTILVKREMWQAYAKQKRAANMPENDRLNSGRKIDFQAQRIGKANVVRDRRTKDAREVTCWSPVYGNGFQEKDALVPLVEK